MGIKGQAVLGTIQDQIAKRRGQKEIQVSQKELSSGVNKEVPGQCLCPPITGKLPLPTPTSNPDPNWGILDEGSFWRLGVPV